MTGKRRTIRGKIEIGKVYNDTIQVNGIAERPYRCYNVKCLKCGNEFVTNAKIIFNMAERGCCGKCAMNKLDVNAGDYVGKIFGNLEVIEFVGLKKSSRTNQRVMKCKCLNCGSVSEIPLTRLKQGGARECKQCAKANLKTGRDVVEMASKEGTNVFSIKNDRALNKNSTTGARGVSYMPKQNKYRAYINFKRKQYHLGSYSTIEEAVEARKKA